MATQAVRQLQLAPLGAGDLIDRTVRLYRRHFLALVRASAPPVVVSAAGWILLTLTIRAMGVTGGFDRLLLYFVLTLLGIVVYVGGLLAQLIILGGASRNLVMNLLWNEPVTARLIYRSVRSRFSKLMLATLAVGAWLLLSLAVALFALFVVLMVGGLVVLAVTATTGPSWMLVLVLIITYLVGPALMLCVFFLLAGLAAYVPQVLMVEGKGVLDSISRSAELARGHVRRLAGMFLFTGFATWAALMLLLVPHGWFGYLNGLRPIVPVFTDTSTMPAWYIVSYEVIGQLSAILLAPVYMMGLSVLYVDQRVRREGYDVELMAAQRFGEMPMLPTGVRAPVAPALAAPQQQQRSRPRDEEKFKGSILGL